jgi:hypothetical protein
MKKKQKIGLITIYHVPNYGSVLQALATQFLLEKKGFECSIINYKYPNEWHQKQRIIVKRTLLYKLIHEIAYILGLTPYLRKNKYLPKFRAKYFNYSKPYDNLDSLKEEKWDEYSAFAVGSDQVWNPQYTFGDSVFLLSFIPDNKFRFSLASSFAVKEIPEKYKDKYRKYLEKFTHISIREQNGINVLKSLGIKNNAKIILDPTLLLTKEDWLQLFPSSKRTFKRKYILLYLLTYAFEPRPYVFHLLKYYKEKLNCDIIALEGYATKKDALGVHMKDYTAATIPQFINLFSNAELVITTSFHGTAFALNYERPLISIIPNNNADDRQYSLLKKLELEQCIVPLNTPFEKINPYYEKISLKTKLNILRNDSINWIDSVLKEIN